MSLSDWQRRGWLTPHTTSAREIGDLLALVQRDLHDSRAPGVSADWRFNIAYNAALQSAKATLAAGGCRTARGIDAHSRTLDSLALTASVPASTVRRLQAYRKRRNSTEYDHAGVTSDAEVDEVHDAAVVVRDAVVEWIRATRPELLHEG